MPRIFISYSREQKEIAQSLANRLQNLGYIVFVDVNSIPGSKEWKKEITSNIKVTDLFVMLVTAAANESHHVFEEYEQAKQFNKQILPIRVDNAPLPLHLTRINAANIPEANKDGMIVEILRVLPVNTSPRNRLYDLIIGLLSLLLAILLFFVFILPAIKKALPIPCSTDLVACSASIVPIYAADKSYASAINTSEGVIVNFSNYQAISGVSFVFNPPLDVRGFTNLHITGTATNQLPFVIEYKVRSNNDLTIVTTSDHQLFPATPNSQAQTVEVPIRFDGAINEIVIDVPDVGSASALVITSIQLTP